MFLLVLSHFQNTALLHWAQNINAKLHNGWFWHFPQTHPFLQQFFLCLRELPEKGRIPKINYVKTDYPGFSEHQEISEVSKQKETTWSGLFNFTLACLLCSASLLLTWNSFLRRVNKAFWVWYLVWLMGFRNWLGSAPLNLQRSFHCKGNAKFWFLQENVHGKGNVISREDLLICFGWTTTQFCTQRFAVHITPQ